MGRKDTNLKSQTSAAITTLKTVVDDLVDVLSGEVEKAQDELNKAKISVQQREDKLQELKGELGKYSKKINWYKTFEEDLNQREKRIETTEGIIEEEKKVLTAKKQHLIEWESELQVKARRLNG